MASLQESDDDRLTILAEVPDLAGADQVSMLLLGNAIQTNVSELRLQLEATSNSPNVLQTIEIFDHLANEFVEVDSRNAEVDEQQIEVVLANNVSRFVAPASGQVITRLKFKAQGPVIFFPWTIEVDQLNWSFN